MKAANRSYLCTRPQYERIRRGSLACEACNFNVNKIQEVYIYKWETSNKMEAGTKQTCILNCVSEVFITPYETRAVVPYLV